MAWAGASNRLYIQYDDHGKRHLATLTLGGNVDDVVDNVGGQNVSRPYTSGAFSVADNGAFAYTAGSAYRPADIAVGRRGRQATILTNLNEDLLGHKELGNVEEISVEIVGRRSRRARVDRDSAGF